VSSAVTISSEPARKLFLLMATITAREKLIFAEFDPDSILHFLSHFALFVLVAASVNHSKSNRPYFVPAADTRIPSVPRD
jgi:hypothetical protein